MHEAGTVDQVDFRMLCNTSGQKYFPKYPVISYNLSIKSTIKVFLLNFLDD